MIEIVEQALRYYINNKKSPTIDSLDIADKSLLEKKGSVFVTLYIGGEVHGSAGNIDPIEDNIV
jgi:AMMECR1 domain-containing protein